jgi:hypothetical protein
MRAVLRDPFQGIGKPEPLKYGVVLRLVEQQGAQATRRTTDSLA